MRSLLFLLMLFPSVGFGMKSLLGSDENKDIVRQLCSDLSCLQKDVLNEVYRLRTAQSDYISYRNALKQSRKEFQQSRENFQKYCVSYEQSILAAGSEKVSGLLLDAKEKCAGIEQEAKARCDELEQNANSLECKLSYLERTETKLNELYNVSEEKDYVVGCTPDDVKVVFRRSDFERDIRFLRCGLYPFLFSENFKKIERADGSRELRDLDGEDLHLLAGAMKHPKYKIKGFKGLDRDQKKVFNSRIDSYGLACVNDVLQVLGTDPNAGVGWSEVRKEVVDDQSFTYYVVRLNEVDFEFVKLLLEDGEAHFMMSHWVTQRQWLAVMKNNPAHFSGCGLDLPMESISYKDITNNFIPRLNVLLKETGFEGKFYLSNGKGWSIMARNNILSDFSTNKSKYSDCEQVGSLAQPLPVKSKLRGRTGAWMFGSMMEWVGDSYADTVWTNGGSFCSKLKDTGPFSTDFHHAYDKCYKDVGFRLFMKVDAI